MTLRQITISLADADVPKVVSAASEKDAIGITIHREVQAEQRSTISMISDANDRQDLLDVVQRILAGRDDWRITISPIEAMIPLPELEEGEAKLEAIEDPQRNAGGLTREEILNDSVTNAQIDQNYLILVLLSGVVAAFGMIADNVAVVIGAMVIAPLLGPVLAFSVGIALGERILVLRAASAAVVGVGLAIAMGTLIGVVWPVDTSSKELQGRTGVGFDGIAIALASGAAATLSLVTGLSSALVGVMVAVALLPPAIASGVFLGVGELDSAVDALLLLLVNIVCINVAAQAVMLARNIAPRTWFEKRKARRRSVINAVVWVALLSALALLLYLRTPQLG